MDTTRFKPMTYESHFNCLFTSKISNFSCGFHSSYKMLLIALFYFNLHDKNKIASQFYFFDILGILNFNFFLQAISTKQYNWQLIHSLFTFLLQFKITTAKTEFHLFFIWLPKKSWDVAAVVVVVVVAHQCTLHSNLFRKKKFFVSSETRRG